MHGLQRKREEAGMCFPEPECLTPDPSQAVMHSRWSCWLAAQSDLRNILHSLAVQKTRKMGIVMRCGDEASSPAADSLDPGGADPT